MTSAGLKQAHGEPMPTLPFSEEEHLSRQSRLRERLREQGFDAMLVFAQESHFWLTGYDTGGYVFFQCSVVTADERPIVLLTRRPDLLQARQTSTIEDIRIWWDAEDANPAADLKVILGELGLAGKRIAVELNTHGLTGWNLWRLQKTLAGFCTLDDDGHMIRRLRLLKSPAEIAYMRKAGELLDRSLDAVIDAAQKALPAGVHLNRDPLRAERFITRAVNTVVKVLVEATIIVAVIILLFLLQIIYSKHRFVSLSYKRFISQLWR